MDGFDPENDENDRHLFYEVTKLKLDGDVFNDSDDSEELDE